MSYFPATQDDTVINLEEPQKKWITFLCPSSAFKSFTFYVTIADILIYLICLCYEFLGGAPYNCVLYNLGADFTPAITVDYQWYRVICPIFLHAGLLHLAANMFTQISCGFFLEDYVGTKRFVILYMGAGIAGNLLSSALNPISLSVGASSSLFGVLALEFVYIMENYDQLGPRRNNMVGMFAFQMIINLSMSTNPNINALAHIGGMIAGFLIAINYLKKAYPD